MPRKPLYTASSLEIDYNGGCYQLKRDNNQNGQKSSYQGREVRSLITNLRKSIQKDGRFKHTTLTLTKRAQEALEEKVKS